MQDFVLTVLAFGSHTDVNTFASNFFGMWFYRTIEDLLLCKGGTTMTRLS
jgi:hypothetical protein